MQSLTKDNQSHGKHSAKTRQIVSIHSKKRAESQSCLKSRPVSRKKVLAQSIVENNAVSQVCISMKSVIQKSRVHTANSTSAIKPEAVVGDQPVMIGTLQLGGTQSIINQLILGELLSKSYENGELIKFDENGHPILKGMTQSQLDNLNYIKTMNLRKQIPQGINQEIINRNKDAISTLSLKNKSFIQSQQ